MVTLAERLEATTSNKENHPNNEDCDNLECCECRISFSNQYSLYNHLFNHIKQPRVVLQRYQLPPLKITINRTGKNFEILKSPTDNIPLIKSNLAAEDSDNTTTVITVSETQNQLTKNIEEIRIDETTIDYYEEQKDGNQEGEIVETPTNETDEHQEFDVGDEEQIEQNEEEENQQQINDEDETTIHNDVETADFIDNETNLSSTNSDGTNRKIVDDIEDVESTDYGDIQRIESPKQSESGYPKIRIKTTGLLKDAIGITEIRDDHSKEIETNADTAKQQNSWNNSIEDPLKLPSSNDNLISLFNNNERAKDLGFTTSDSEFISLDRLEERNRNALQLYNPPSSTNQNALNNLTGLPMEALAQQVSRLQPQSSNGMHQQNVLINIQQFPQAPPPPPPYQPPPPPMYHHPHPAQPPMYHQPYQYQPPNPMYYPPAPPPPPGYPQHMPPPPPPPQPQMPPMSQPTAPPISVSQNQSQQYHRSLVQQRPQAPRQLLPHGQRMQGPPRQPGPSPRQPGTATRARGPTGVRPRGTAPAIRGVKLKIPVQQNGANRNQQQQPTKRASEQLPVLIKRKKFDVLTPDKDDDDCQVICMQPNNKDGGLPQIQSVQGGTPEPQESNVMHLSDSITLSVRNPQPRSQSPKRSDAKAVANILATRGITVTATPKPKEKTDPKNPPLPSSLNLNGAVSIIPSIKNPTKPDSQLPTVDLTDDSPVVSSPLSPPPPPPPPPPLQSKSSNQQQQKNNSKTSSLPFKCDLCPAQYPNCIGLTKHRQNYHKVNNNQGEIGIPLINLKQPGVFQKLAALGIYNYIPLPSSGPDGTFAFPIIHSRSGSASGLGATTMLTLGPIRYIPKPTQNGVNKQNQK